MEPEPLTETCDVQLLAATRAGDIDKIKKLTETWNEEDIQRLTNSKVFPLHLASIFGHLELVQHFINKAGFDINQQNLEGNTPLHLAASQAHVDVVSWLLSQDTIDDNIQNAEKKDAVSCSCSEELSALMLDNRFSFIEKATQQLLRLAQQNDFAGVFEMFSYPRVSQFVDINVRDPTTGRTCLHEAAQANNLEAAVWLMENNANILITDHNNKIPYDLATDPKVRDSLSETHPSNKPSSNEHLEGYLKKWTNLASGFRTRYFVLKDGTFSYYKSSEDVINPSRGSIDLNKASVHWKEGSAWFEVDSVGDKKFELRANHVVEAKKWVTALLKSKEERCSIASSADGSSLNQTGSKVKPKVTHRIRNSLSVATHKKRISVVSLQSGKPDEILPVTPKFDSRSAPMQHELSEPISNSSYPDIGIGTDSNLRSTLVNLDGQINSQKLLLHSKLSQAKHTLDNLSISPEEFGALLNSLLDSLNNQTNLIHDALTIDAEREESFRKYSLKQFEKETFWRENLEALAKDHNDLEHLLRKHSYSNKSKVDVPTLVNHKDINSISNEAGEEPEVCLSDNEEDFFDAEDGMDTIMADSLLKQGHYLADNDDSDKEISRVDAKTNIRSSYAGYPQDGKFREKLELSGEITPDISIWSILKNSVGKDLTKIAVPVEFNESTSMLQRMCEDMEYSNLLDIAVKQASSTERMLWVAGFAMSNYSSTLGRTGKPFNPLLGETFEYVRPDRGFRYVSEQVSHHPPISACFCESPNYVFQAEVNLISKFWGKSFELNPKGVTHLYLKIPSENGTTVKEHYSWTKVTSAMNNIIIGTMYIEHYGDMKIKNHRTGDECILSFQRTGWRSSNKHVIRGKIRDYTGRELWEIGGRWDDKLVARRVGINDGQDIIANADDCSNPAYHPGDGAKPILLWKMAPRPDPKLAYNLTNFAVSLNELPEQLIPYLPPTDSRHRPDQKAMERGDFSSANDLKVELEDRQRRRRKMLESSGFSHQPRWFTKDIDVDTESPIWTFNPEYWEMRLRCGNEIIHGTGPGRWENVDSIFQD